MGLGSLQGWLLEPLAPNPLDFTALLILSNLVSLVVLPLPSRKGHFQLSLAVSEVEPGGDDRETLFLGATCNRIDFAAVHEELSISTPFREIRTCVRVGLNVQVQDPKLRVADGAVGIGKIRPPKEEALDLGALERKSSFKRVQQLVVVPRLPILDLPRPFRTGLVVLSLGHRVLRPRSGRGTV